MRPATVAIIGGGASGTLTALQLLRQSRGSHLSIAIIERSSTVGRGLAYQVPSDRCKLNVPVQGMSAFPDDPSNFFEWIRQQDATITGDEFVSRRLYGTYLGELLQYHSQHSTNVSLRTIEGEARDLSFSPDINKWCISFSDLASLQVDYCVLALGNLRRASFCGYKAEEFFYDPYDTASYEALREQDSILIVGSGLTAVDSVLEAEGSGFKGSYTLLSRHGRLPLPHEPAISPSPAMPALTTQALTTLPIRQLTNLFVSSARDQGSSQAAIQLIRPHIQDIWTGLSVRDKRCFLRHVRPIWEVHRHRIPKAHHDVLESLRAQGRLTIIAGHLRSIVRSANCADVELSTQGILVKRSFGGLLLCAGPEGDLTKVQNPLVRNLLDRKLLQAGPLGLGGFINSDTPGCSTISMIGPLQREALWEITAVREIRSEAEKLAKHIVARVTEA